MKRNGEEERREEGTKGRTGRKEREGRKRGREWEKKGVRLLYWTKAKKRRYRKMNNTGMIFFYFLS